MASKRSEMEEARAKVKLVLSNYATSKTVQELAQDPLLNSMSTRAISAHLRFLAKQKEVRKQKDKKWTAGAAVLRARSTVAVSSPDSLGPAFFVVNPVDKTIALDFGGLRLPVVLES